MSYLLIIVVVLITPPFILRLAQSQKKEIKRILKLVLLIIITTQIILGFLNWENFTSGRNGFELSLTYPDSFLGLFFIINVLGFQAVSFASIGVVFLVLVGNVIGLNFINKDKNLLKKYFRL